MKTKISLIILCAAMIIGALCGTFLTTKNVAEASGYINGALQTNELQDIQLLSVPPVGGETGDETTAPIYTESNKRIGYIRASGLLITADGEPVCNQEDGSATFYDEETKTFIDSANRSLDIYLNSQLGRQYLKAGGKFITSITMDREVFLVEVKSKVEGREIDQLVYVFREKAKYPWWQVMLTLGMPGPTYRYFDIQGRQIDNALLITTKGNPGVARFAAALCGSVFEIMEQTTLAELYVSMEHATIHPWDLILDPDTSLPVISKDGKVVYIKPDTNQIVDFYGWALYNKNTGLPLMFLNDEIVSINKTEYFNETVESSVLVNTMSLWQLLESGINFYMGIMESTWGEFNVPMLKLSDDPKKNDFVLMNGDDANPLTIGHLDSQSQNGIGFFEWIKSIFSSVGSFFKNLINIVIIILLVFLLMSCVPLVLAIVNAVKSFFRVLMPEKKNQYKRRQY